MIVVLFLNGPHLREEATQRLALCTLSGDDNMSAERSPPKKLVTRSGGGKSRCDSWQSLYVTFVHACQPIKKHVHTSNQWVARRVLWDVYFCENKANHYVDYGSVPAMWKTISELEYTWFRLDQEFLSHVNKSSYQFHTWQCSRDTPLLVIRPAVRKWHTSTQLFMNH